MSTLPTTLKALPLFPLRTVLFPDGLLPLQVFEVRYLDMIGSRHKAGEPFGVVCLSEGHETRQRAADGDGGFAREAFLPVGTLARITRFERPQPGLMIIECTGAQRFRVERSEQLRHGLWMADVTLLPDDAVVAVPDDLAFTRDALQRLVRDIAASRDESDADAIELPLREPYRWDDCGWLANRWCELLPLPAEQRHRFLSLDSPVLRLELVGDTLRQMGVAADD